MANTFDYKARRNHLKTCIKSGIIILMGNTESPVNYRYNPYPFRQDSTFLYYTGINKPGYSLVIDLGKDIEYLVRPENNKYDHWTPQTSLKTLLETASINDHKSYKAAQRELNESYLIGQCIHFLPTYSVVNQLRLSDMIGIDMKRIPRKASPKLMETVIYQRAIKEPGEIEQIDQAVDITMSCMNSAKNFMKPGISEKELAQQIYSSLATAGCRPAFQPTISTQSHFIHAAPEDRLLEDRHLCMIDIGAELESGYSGDITRTFPVSGNMNAIQKDLFDIVSTMQTYVVEKLTPRSILCEAQDSIMDILFSGLKSIGVLKEMPRNPREKVHLGREFFPHRIGHLLGLDSHDMEGIWKEMKQFRARALWEENYGIEVIQFHSPLKPGMTLAIETGIYLHPHIFERPSRLIEKYLNIPVLEKFKQIGGIRVEDNFLITEKGHRLLGSSHE